jgi:hypothetical protein
MTFNTYIINLSTQYDRYKRTIKNLQNENLYLHRFEAYTKETAFKYHPDKIHNICKTFCNDVIIGCAMSHIILAKQILQNDSNPFALVLEDDIYIKKEYIGNLKDVVYDEYEKNKNADIILLFCQGVCNISNSNTFTGSTAAYILTKKGASKIANTSVVYHIDWVRNNFDTVIGKTLFGTYDTKSPFTIGNQSLSFWANQKIVKIYGKDITVLYFLLFGLLSTVILHYINIPYKIKVNIISFIFSLFSTLVIYLQKYIYNYKCSTITHIFGLIFSIVMIFYINLQNKLEFKEKIALNLSYSMLSFHTFYQVF